MARALLARKELLVLGPLEPVDCDRESLDVNEDSPSLPEAEASRPATEVPDDGGTEHVLPSSVHKKKINK